MCREVGLIVCCLSLQDEAIQKRIMIPLQLYKTSAGSLRGRQWGIIDPASLSPWNIMSWGMKQLRGFVAGTDTLDSLSQLPAQELVLVQNLKVRELDIPINWSPCFILSNTMYTHLDANWCDIGDSEPGRCAICETQLVYNRTHILQRWVCR